MEYYKFVKEDIWGVLKTTFFKKNLICKFFFSIFKSRRRERIERMRRYIYRLDEKYKPNKKKKSFPKIISFRLVKFFYIIYSYKWFNKMAILARKRDGLFEMNYIYLIECRITSIIYRTSFYKTPFEILSVIKDGNILVNRKFIFYNNYIVNLFTLIGFRPSYKKRLYSNLLSRIKKRRILFNTPKFMYISYRLLLAYIKRIPNYNELIYPSSVDIFRVIGYN